MRIKSDGGPAAYSGRRLRTDRFRRQVADCPAAAAQGHGRAMGISGRQGRSRRIARGGADSRASRRTGHYRKVGLPGTFHVRFACLSGIPPSDAPLCLPQMGRPTITARAHGSGVGLPEQAQILPDATSGPAPDPDALRSFVTRFFRDCRGVTAIEYGLIVALMTLAILGSVYTLGQTALQQLFMQIASSL